MLKGIYFFKTGVNNFKDNGVIIELPTIFFHLFDFGSFLRTLCSSDPVTALNLEGSEK